MPDFSVKGNYFNVYNNSISSLGLLQAPLPKEIATFYTYAMSAVEDLNWMAEVNEKSITITAEKALTELEPLMNVLNETILIGKRIIQRIEESPNNALQ